MRVMSAAFQEGLGETALSARKTIPFEYSFRFSLTGVRDTTLTRTITVSVESSFVAVSIGYGVVPTDSTVTFGVPPAARPIFLAAGSGLGTLVTTNIGELITSIAQSVEENDALLKGTIGPATAAVLTNGFKLNPRLAERILLGAGKSNVDTPELATMFSSIGVPAGQVQFLYALRD